MILINTSEVIADLLPEVSYTLDPDTPCYDEIPVTVRRFVKDLILHAFFHVLKDDLRYNGEWLARIRQDRFLNAVSDRQWVDLEVVDTDGTFVLIIEECKHDHRFYR